MSRENQEEKMLIKDAGTFLSTIKSVVQHLGSIMVMTEPDGMYYKMPFSCMSLVEEDNRVYMIMEDDAFDKFKKDTSYEVTSYNNSQLTILQLNVEDK